MTSPTPRQLARTDQANAATDTFINDVLTDMVTEIQAGLAHANVTARIGGGIIRLQLGEVERLVLASRALARLARLHHAVEQLADTHDANGMPNAAAELRKLVDDHG